MTMNRPQTPVPVRPPPEDDRHLIDVPALAQRLGVTERFIRRLTAEDRVPFLKIGKFVRFDPLEIDDWVDAKRQQSVLTTLEP